jgi:hypothetical protein
VNGSTTQGVVVEQQHGLLSCLGVVERDEAVALKAAKDTTASNRT